ncbi:PhoH-like phosphate starvation-inducible [Staphylococcus phage S-CoN_Ph11]|nr:PhoH-like phosphate starvation-inducible [Staphylococcus phage S-CoN_Ph11]
MITLAKMDKELKYKLQNFPLVQYNMLEHTVFDDFLNKATQEQLQFCEDFFNDDIEILFNESPAGTGKTMCSVACAYADWLNKGKEISVYYCTSFRRFR